MFSAFSYLRHVKMSECGLTTWAFPQADQYSWNCDVSLAACYYEIFIWTIQYVKSWKRMLLPVIPNDSALKGSCRPKSSLLRDNQLSVLFSGTESARRFFIDIGLADLKRASPEIVLLVLNLQICFLTLMVIIMGTSFTLDVNAYDIMFAWFFVVCCVLSLFQMKSPLVFW